VEKALSYRVRCYPLFQAPTGTSLTGGALYRVMYQVRETGSSKKEKNAAVFLTCTEIQKAARSWQGHSVPCEGLWVHLFTSEAALSWHLANDRHSLGV
jgi:hypothetical protein